jgi:hypothetical protein
LARNFLYASSLLLITQSHGRTNTKRARALDSGEEKEGLDARPRMLSPGQIVKPTQRLWLPKGSLEQFLFSPRNILFEGLAGFRCSLTHSFYIIGETSPRSGLQIAPAGAECDEEPVFRPVDQLQDTLLFGVACVLSVALAAGL